MATRSPWFTSSYKFKSNADIQKQEAEDRLKAAQALSAQAPRKPKKKSKWGIFSDVAESVVDAGSAVVDKTVDVAEETGDVAKGAGKGALKGLETWGNQVQSVPATFATKGYIDDEGRYQTRFHIGNPLSNARSHIKAQKKAGLLPEDAGRGNILSSIAQGFTAANRAGKAYSEDPDISSTIKFITGTAFDPSTYVGAGLVGKAAKAPVAGRLISKPGISGKALRGAIGLAEGFDKPSTVGKFIAGGALGTELANRVDVPGVPEPVEQIGGQLLGGGLGASLRGRPSRSILKTAESLDVPGDTVTVYHGTTGEFEGDTLRPGSFVTTSYEEARKYAETSAKLSGGEPQVLEFQADPDAIADPIEESFASTFGHAKQVVDPDGLWNVGISGGANPETLVKPREPGVGLTKGEKIGNSLTTVKRFLLNHGIKNDAVATPIAKEFTRQNSVVRNQAKSLANIGKVVEKALQVDENGISKITGVTVADMAENYSTYKPLLSKPQQDAVDFFRWRLEAFDQTLKEYGVEPNKFEITDPEGFYVPRGRTKLEGAEEAPELSPKFAKQGGTPGYEKDRAFDTQAQGIKAGYMYPRVSEALQSYGNSVADRISQTWLANKVKELEIPGGKGAVDLYQTSGFSRVELPSEVSDVLNRELNKIHPPKGAEASELYGSINNFFRQLWATADMSLTGIQQLPTWFDRPDVAAKSFGTSLKSLTDDATLGEFIKNHDLKVYGTGKPTTTEMVSGGLHLNSGINPDTGEISERIAKVPGFKQVLGGSNKMFANGGDVTRINLFDTLWDSYKSGIPIPGLKISGKGASREEVIQQISNAVNRSTGYSTSKLGGGVGQAVLFAPRFIQSQLETIAKAATDGTIEGQVARRQLGKMIVAGSALTYFLNEARGKETSWDPRDSNFMRIRDVAGSDFSVFGPWDSLVKGVIRGLPQVNSDGDITLGDPTYIVRSKLSPILGTSIDWLLGENVVGEPTREPKSIFKNTILPFSTREVLDQPPLETAAGFFGIKGTELTDREKLDKALSEAGINKDDEDYLIERREYLAEHPELVPSSDKDPYRQADETREDITSRRQQNEELLTSGGQSLVDFRENRTLLIKEQRDKLDAIYKGKQPKGIDSKQGKWLSSYYKLFDESSNPITNKTDPDKFDAAVSKWMATEGVGEEALAFVNAYLGAGLPEVEEQYYEDMQTLEKAGYFDLDKYHNMRSGLTEDEIDALAQKVISARVASPTNAPFAVTASNILKGEPQAVIQDVINSQKQGFQNPERTKFKQQYYKELQWFNPRADWNSYINAQPPKAVAPKLPKSSSGSSRRIGGGTLKRRISR